MHACICIDVHFASLASSYTQRIPSRSSSGLLPSGLPTAQPAASQPLTQRPPNRSTSCLPTAHSAAPNRSLLVTAVSRPLTFGHSGLLLFTAASQPIAFMRASFVFKLFFLGTPAPTLRPTARCTMPTTPKSRSRSPSRGRRSGHVGNYKMELRMAEEPIPNMILVCVFCRGMVMHAENREVCISCKHPCVKYYREIVSSVQLRVNRLNGGSNPIALVNGPVGPKLRAQTWQGQFRDA